MSTKQRNAVFGKKNWNLKDAIKNKDTVKMLEIIENTADINASILHPYDLMNTAKTTLLNIVIERNFVELVPILLEKGADPNLPSDSGLTPLTEAICIFNYDFGKCIPSYDTVKILIEYGADVNQKSSNGFTPLIKAISVNSFEIVEILIQHGADVNIFSERIIDFGIRKDYKKIIKNISPLLATIIFDVKKEIIELLVKHDAKFVDIPDLENYIIWSIDNYTDPDTFEKFLPIINKYKLFRNFEVYKPPSLDKYTIMNNPIDITSIEIPVSNDINIKNNPEIANTLEKHKEYIHSHKFNDIYTITQYTYHGDKIINSFMRGVDNMETYEEEIPTRGLFAHQRQQHHDAMLFFIFFYLMFDLNEFPDNIKHGYIVIPKFKKWFYLNKMYPLLDPTDKTNAHKTKIFEKLRTYSFNYFKFLYNVIQRAPKMEHPFRIYRGVETHYLKDTGGDDVFYLSSFCSTSYMIKPTDSFGGIKYHFYVHPSASYMFFESVSKFPKEKEVLLVPYLRYIHVKTEEKTDDSYETHHYSILPTDLTIPNEFDEFMTWYKPHVGGGRFRKSRRRVANVMMVSPNNATTLRIHNKQPNIRYTRTNKVNLKSVNKVNNTKRNQNKTRVNKKSPSPPHDSRLRAPLSVYRHRRASPDEKTVALALYKALGGKE